MPQPPTHREHVSRKKRDGLMKSRSWSGSSEGDKRSAHLLGQEAHHAKVPRYGNPLTATRAAAWTAGWNAAHAMSRGTPETPEDCPGCRLCLNGTTTDAALRLSLSERFPQRPKLRHKTEKK